MKVVQINSTCGVGSTGKICVSISKLLSDENVENYILYTSGTSNYPLGIKCSGTVYKKIQALKSRIFGNYGFNSKTATKKMIEQLESIRPDIIHLHNIHGHDCNLEMLFNYIKKSKMKLVCTFHDCWFFTGYCTHFDMIGCEKWKNGCYDCPQYKEYSWFFDRSAKLCKRKKGLLEDIDLTVVTPSKWLADITKQSFLGNYEIQTINNGIDLSVFKHTKSVFKEKNKLCDKRIVLGVSFGWNEKKGLDVFIELSKRLPEDYQIVLVGTNEKTDKLLPGNIISIHGTHDQKELAEIYTAADVFVNPTREENYPTVNMEAIACGTPVVTFRTGGSPEIVGEGCGCVVEKDDIDAIEREIIRICEGKPYSSEDCINYAKRFDKDVCFKKYLELYRSLV